MRMPFGKYKGQPLEDLPTSYLQWIMADLTMERATLFMQAVIRPRHRGRHSRPDAKNKGDES